jgi:hypothetical protein
VLRCLVVDMAAVSRAGFEVAVPRPGGGCFASAGGLVLPGADPGPRAEVGGGGEAVMSAVVSAMMMSATVRLTPGMLVSRSRGRAGS